MERDDLILILGLTLIMVVGTVVNNYIKMRHAENIEKVQPASAPAPASVESSE